MRHPKFKIEQVNHNYLIALYSTKNQDGQKIMYGLVDEGWFDIKFYRCTMDGEPQGEAHIRNGAQIMIETPKGNTKLETRIRDYINNHPQMIGF